MHDDTNEEQATNDRLWWIENTATENKAIFDFIKDKMALGWDKEHLVDELGLFIHEVDFEQRIGLSGSMGNLLENAMRNIDYRKVANRAVELYKGGENE